MRNPAASRSTRSIWSTLADCSSSTRSPSVYRPRPAWFTRNPGWSPATTARWPAPATSSRKVVTTSGAVRTAAITSATFMSGTGLKKCSPATLCGWAHAAAISATTSDEVLLARIACGDTIASRLRNNARLASRSSTMASIRTSQSARSCIVAAAWIRPRMRSNSSASMRPFATPRPIMPTTNSTALPAAPSKLSKQCTRCPAWAKS
ncbi:hypothetical protein FQZ97_923960 [compost metagenome]